MLLRREPFRCALAICRSNQYLSTMRRQRLLIAGALVGFALLAGGCGGGVAERSTSSQGLTKAAFIKRADQICERTDKVQNAALQSYIAKQSGGTPNETVNEAAVLVAGLPPIRTEARKIHALLVPAGDEDEIQAIVDGIEEAIKKGEKDPGSLVNSKSAGPFDAVGKLARDYGFKACALPL